MGGNFRKETVLHLLHAFLNPQLNCPIYLSNRVLILLTHSLKLASLTAKSDRMIKFFCILCLIL
jgi:hypothetical protein